MSRRALPDRRAFRKFRTPLMEPGFRCPVGYYVDGNAGEVFIDSAKIGQDAQCTARDAAIAVSIAIQHGVRLLGPVRTAPPRSVAQ